jgi:hypothetical protein
VEVIVGTLITAFVAAAGGLITALLRSIDSRIAEAFKAKDQLIEDYRTEIARLRVDVEQFRMELAQARAQIADLERQTH